MSKIDAPVLPPPAVQLGDAQAPQITLPTIDRKAAYDCVAKLFDFDTADESKPVQWVARSASRTVSSGHSFFQATA